MRMNKKETIVIGNYEFSDENDDFEYIKKEELVSLTIEDIKELLKKKEIVSLLYLVVEEIGRITCNSYDYILSDILNYFQLPCALIESKGRFTNSGEEICPAGKDPVYWSRRCEIVNYFKARANNSGQEIFSPNNL